MKPNALFTFSIFILLIGVTVLVVCIGSTFRSVMGAAIISFICAMCSVFTVIIIDTCHFAIVIHVTSIIIITITTTTATT